jgi:predicted small metal-binding protein
MLAIDCPCGHHFEAENEDELFAKCREHVDHDHPEMERTDEQLRARVSADAYEVETAS